jgi:hypothetical protein
VADPGEEEALRKVSVVRAQVHFASSNMSLPNAAEISSIPSPVASDHVAPMSWYCPR